MGRGEIPPHKWGEGRGGEEILVRRGIFSLGGETFYKYWTSIKPKLAWPGVQIVKIKKGTGAMTTAKNKVFIWL